VDRIPFEAIMILCFFAFWPISIIRCWRAKTAKGTSITSYILASLGYISGITYKILHNFDWVTILYCINAITILIGILVYLRNKNLDKIPKK
jgi:hypothetical protein